MVRDYAKIAMKLIMVSLAMLQYILAWATPLESAACLHWGNAYRHRDRYTYYCESNRCRVSAVKASSAQEIASSALALRILSPSSIDWQVPRCLPSQLLCRIVKLMTSATLDLNMQNYIYIYNI